MQLNAKQTYLFGTTGDGGLACRRVRHYSFCEYPESERHVHTGILHYDKQWLLLECNMDDGVIERSMWEVIRGNKGYHKLEAFPYPHVDLEVGRKLIGKPFSLDKMYRLKNYPNLPPISHLKDDPGFICGEFVAECDNGRLARQLQVKPYDLRSVDYQRIGQRSKFEIASFARKAA